MCCSCLLREAPQTERGRMACLMASCTAERQDSELLCYVSYLSGESAKRALNRQIRRLAREMQVIGAI